MLFVHVDYSSGNNGATIWLYSFAWTVQHAIIEGITFMFLQKGCGRYAAIVSSQWTFGWCLITFALQVVIYSSSGFFFFLAQGAWNMMQLVFYLVVWLVPAERLYRRPAAIAYAQFWFWFRLAVISCIALEASGVDILFEIGACSYAFGPLLTFTIVQPAVCYLALLNDCR